MGWVDEAHRTWHAETGQPMYKMNGQPFCPWDCADYDEHYDEEEE